MYENLNYLMAKSYFPKAGLVKQTHWAILIMIVEWVKLTRAVIKNRPRNIVGLIVISQEADLVK